MKNCLKCSKTIPTWVLVDGKNRNFQRRKYCLECSPFGCGNTRKIELPKPARKRTDARYYKWQKKARRERKQRLVDIFGGMCIICGYCKSLRGLSFHHRDPAEKKFSLTASNLLKKWEIILEEANKCDLLCHNCHSETHENEDYGYLAELD